MRHLRCFLWPDIHTYLHAYTQTPTHTSHIHIIRCKFPTLRPVLHMKHVTSVGPAGFGIFLLFFVRLPYPLTFTVTYLHTYLAIVEFPPFTFLAQFRSKTLFHLFFFFCCWRIKCWKTALTSFPSPWLPWHTGSKVSLVVLIVCPFGIVLVSTPVPSDFWHAKLFRTTASNNLRCGLYNHNYNNKNHKKQKDNLKQTAKLFKGRLDQNYLRCNILCRTSAWYQKSTINYVSSKFHL